MVSLRKLLPRFSLRTLVILPVLIGCMTAWYVRWTPWHAEAIFKGDIRPGFVETRGTPQHGVTWSIALSEFTLVVDGREVANGQLEDFMEGLDRFSVVGWAMMSRTPNMTEVTLTGQMARVDEISGHDDAIGRVIAPSTSVSWATVSSTKLIIWRAHRLSDILWMRESWLTLFFAALLTWSVIRDRKTLRRKP